MCFVVARCRRQLAATLCMVYYISPPVAVDGSWRRLYLFHVTCRRRQLLSTAAGGCSVPPSNPSNPFLLCPPSNPFNLFLSCPPSNLPLFPLCLRNLLCAPLSRKVDGTTRSLADCAIDCTSCVRMILFNHLFLICL